MIRSTRYNTLYVGISGKSLANGVFSDGRFVHHLRKLIAAKGGATNHTKGWRGHAIDRYQAIKQVAESDPNIPLSSLTAVLLMAVLERVEPLDDSHGPQRLAILFLGAEGIATYDALFCQGRYPACFAMVIQEHGFGGNYNAFGHGSLLDQIASETSTYPEWMLVADNSECWDGYEPVPNLQPTRGGMHSMKRVIYRRCSHKISFSAQRPNAITNSC